MDYSRYGEFDRRSSLLLAWKRLFHFPTANDFDSLTVGCILSTVTKVVPSEVTKSRIRRAHLRGQLLPFSPSHVWLSGRRRRKNRSRFCCLGSSLADSSRFRRFVLSPSDRLSSGLRGRFEAHCAFAHPSLARPLTRTRGQYEIVSNALPEDQNLFDIKLGLITDSIVPVSSSRHLCMPTRDLSVAFSTLATYCSITH